MYEKVADDGGGTDYKRSHFLWHAMNANLTRQKFLVSACRTLLKLAAVSFFRIVGLLGWHL